MSEKKPIRSFIALELSRETRDELSSVINYLKISKADVKWTRPDSIHLTLKFLGNIEEDMVELISGALAEALKEGSSFKISLSRPGVFPGWSKPRVVWIGLDEGRDDVKRLVSLVGSAMRSLGFEREERDFKAHLTLGRMRSPKNKEKLKKLFEELEVAPVVCHIDRVILFSSELTPEGAIYTPLSEIPLKK